MIYAFVAAIIASCAAVGIVRAYAIRHAVLDHPNDRSSHTHAVPRGGGIGVIVAIVGVFIATDASKIGWALALALIGLAPTLLAGWIDDHRRLGVKPRLVAHLLSALLVLPLAVQGRAANAATFLLGCGIVLLVIAAINVINFMDGIDALIALQATVFAAHLAILSPGEGAPRGLAVVIGAATIGFLVWNWPPARIFLGDVGSGALAVACMIAGLLVWRQDQWTFLAVFAPVIPLFLDATLTLLRRIRRGEDVSVAHRTHLYQRLANEAGWGHAAVSLSLAFAAVAGSATVILTNGSTVAVIVYGVAVLLVGLALSRRQAARASDLLTTQR